MPEKKNYYLGAGLGMALGLIFILAIPLKAQAQTDWQKKWDGLIAAAKKEGAVVVAASPSPRTRAEIEPAFMKQFGFRLDYLALGGAESNARIEREAAAGKISIDVLLSGNSELYNLLPAGRLESLKDKLILPEALDTTKLRDKKFKYNDPEQRYFLQTMEYILPDVFINTQFIKKGAITTWKDLLNPEYKGKIASFDPRRGGQGQAIAAYALQLFGADFVKQLFIGQNVAYTADRRQLGDWLARGTYPIGIAVATREIEEARALGIPIERVFPRNQGGVTGGSSVIKIVRDAPHPNASAVFLNWFLTREPQEIFQRTNDMVSRRNDVGTKGVPDYVIPVEGVKYVDTYSLDYMEYYPKAQKMLQELLGGR